MMRPRTAPMNNNNNNNGRSSTPPTSNSNNNNNDNNNRRGSSTYGSMPPQSLSSTRIQQSAANNRNTTQRRPTSPTTTTEESPLSLNGMLRELAATASSTNPASTRSNTLNSNSKNNINNNNNNKQRQSKSPATINNNGPNVSAILPNNNNNKNKQTRNNNNTNKKNQDYDYGDGDDDDDSFFNADDQFDDDDGEMLDESFQMKALNGAVLQDRDTQVGRLKQTLAAVQGQRDAYESESQSLARENATLVNTVEESHRQVSELQQQIKGLQNDKSHLLGERDNLSTRLRMLEARRLDDDVLLKERTERAEQAVGDMDDELRRARNDASTAQLALDEARSNFENEKQHISRTLTRLQRDMERLSGETSNRERIAEAENAKLKEHLAAASERVTFLEETARQQEVQIDKIENYARQAESREGIARGEAVAAGQAASERDELAQELTHIARRHSEAHQRWKEEREQIVAVNIRLQQDSQQDHQTIEDRERQIYQLKRDLEDRDDKIHSLAHELAEAQKTAAEFQKNMGSLQFQHQKLAERMMAGNAARRSNMKLFDEKEDRINNNDGTNDSQDGSNEEYNNNNNNGAAAPTSLLPLINAATNSKNNNNNNNNNGSVALSLQSVCDNAVRRVHIAHEESMKLTQENTSLRHQLTIANEERLAIEALLQKKQLEATELLRKGSDRVTELQERLSAEREACRASESERTSILDRYEKVNSKLENIVLDEDKLRHLVVECEELRRVRGNLEGENTKYVNQIARLEEQNRTIFAQREDATRRLSNFKESTAKSIKDCNSFAEKFAKDTELHFTQKLSSLEKQLGDRNVAWEDRRRLKERVADLESQLAGAQNKLKTTSQRLATEITRKEEVMRHASEKKVVDAQEAEEEQLREVEAAKAMAIEELKKIHQQELNSLRKRVGESLRREVHRLHHQHNVDDKSGRAWMKEALVFFSEMDDISKVVARGAKAVDLDSTSGGILQQIEETIAATLKLIAADREKSREPADPHMKEQLFGRIDSRLRDDELKSRANDITRAFFGETSLRTLVDHQMEVSPGRGGAAAGNSEEAVAVLREQIVATMVARSVNRVVTQFMQTVRSGLTNAPRVVDVVDSHRHTFESMIKYGSIDARKEEVRSAVEDQNFSKQQQQQQQKATASSNGSPLAATVQSRMEADDITNKVFDGVNVGGATNNNHNADGSLKSLDNGEEEEL